MSDISKLNPIRPQMNGATPVSKEEKAAATDAKFHEVSELYENHFIREMMKQMRSTVHESGFLKKNNAEKIFSDQLDDQYADQWGKAGGIGLSGLIYEQLMQKYGEQMGLKDKTQKPHGPLDIDAKSNFNGVVSKAAAGPETEPVTFKFETAAGQKTEIKNPWAGTLLDKKYLEMDQMQYRIKHDNGLESLIMTRGTGLGPDAQLSPGDVLQSGQQLGWASASSPLFWTVKTNVSE